ncbi:interleukin-24 isoform X2 [Pipistrellus kuhlii]|uniref:interleukin-24 isoform X2 n=1 Tax=Pipistrellus kuhlii TaxID=59472 RepID=UPI00174EFCFE|nr:interleukin-24 isoform X2 [Pipistrellus kuhlii]
MLESFQRQAFPHLPAQPWGRRLSFFSILLVLPPQQMGSPMQKAALPCLSLILLIWSQGPGVQGQQFQFGPCRVEGVAFQELWQAFRAMKDIVQAQDNIMSVQLLRREVLQNVSGAESCYLLRALLNFYLNTVFRNYHKKAAELRILRSFSTLANNFIVILSKLQPSRKMRCLPSARVHAGGFCFSRERLSSWT